ncbi:hypothetical protein RJ640_025103 [Escallonia rubra]|uniref:RNase H type-1 domain-containing protein n=1 Tax=Escallonia rubra TaxID=112253 RepID=A0AA88UDM3_9ASTE|nr:hypothetical protein RJ640_025103 [Escallonia rubra]
MNILTDLFCQNETEIIKRNSDRGANNKDRLLRHYTRNGQFRVSSTYRLIMDRGLGNTSKGFPHAQKSNTNHTLKVFVFPAAGIYKVYFGATLSKETVTLGVGVMVRDSQGIFFVGLSMKIDGMTNLEIAGGQAAMEGNRFALEPYFWEIKVEGDSTE